MSLFEVDGWDLNKKIVKVKSDKGKKGKADKARREKRKLNSREIQQLVTSGTVREDSQEKKREHKEVDQTVELDKKRKNREEVSEKVTNESVQSIQQPKKLKSEAKSKPEKNLTPLQQKMVEKLSGSRFRWINEQLYTTTSGQALDLIKNNPDMFEEYHKGFRSQVHSWPENPVDTMVQQFKTRTIRPVNAPGGLPGDTATGTVVVADMGCGEAQLAADLAKIKGTGKSRKLNLKVHSFDLKKVNSRITVADIKHVPMEDQSADVVVFCLALMGTNFIDFITEAFRILKPRGEVWIAEIKSRFPSNDTQAFVDKLKSIGLFHRTTDEANKMFVRFEFFKPPKDILERRDKKQEERQKGKKFIDKEEEEENPNWVLKPCIYKRR